jgi:hypothetical protein
MDLAERDTDGRNRLERGVGWALRNLDGLVGLGIAVVVGVLDIFSGAVSTGVTSGTVLLVLASLVFASLAERKRRTTDMRRAMQGTQQAIADAGMVRSLTGPEVEQALRRARADTDRWIFRGGTGTYLRAVTLPECVREAQRLRRALSMKVDIVDPSDDRVCATYARFRQTFAAPQDVGTEREWTVERTRAESYATVLAACWYRQRMDALEIDVYLSATVPALRFDLSSSYLVITQDDPQRVNLCVDQGRPLYDYYVTELRLARDQARKVNLEVPVLLGQEPTVDQVRRLFEAMDLPLPTAYSDTDVRTVVDKALHPEHPYRI